MQDIGDLWKAIWTEDDGFEAFDLEAEEVLSSKQKWERRQKQFNNSTNTADSVTPSSRRLASRAVVSNDFTVKGIEHGIILSASFSKGARQGVYWPARVMNASESGRPSSQGKRNSAKQKVDIVFLSPYWAPAEPTRGRRVEARSELGVPGLGTIPLLHVETVDATDEVIKPYPYDGTEGLCIDQLRMAFRFTGLPKNTFQRFVDSHRLALALRTYAMNRLNSQMARVDRVGAGLLDSHPLAAEAPIFPSVRATWESPVVTWLRCHCGIDLSHLTLAKPGFGRLQVALHLPFEYILSQLPKHSGEQASDNSMQNVEPVISLSKVVEAMRPPSCFGLDSDKMSPSGPRCPGTPETKNTNVVVSTPSTWLASLRDGNDDLPALDLNHFVSDLDHLKNILDKASAAPPIAALLDYISGILSKLSAVRGLDPTKMSTVERQESLQDMCKSWSVLKNYGEDVLPMFSNHALPDWRRAAERIYKYMANLLSGDGYGNGISMVLTDSRCNGHLSSNGCFERNVRLPAAVKAAKLAGASDTGTKIRLVDTVPGDDIVDFVERKILVKAHSASYLSRMKKRCLSAKSDDEELVLTDGSDGTGGHDTCK